ncbi:hypothetical protein [Paraburkholderia sp. UYCP14C]|uniref:hypothetical protein n=1 Tax=Paraburkholderia sp. UYCP14C TaxID=2511130 RepID=UPI0020071A9A|nr:hypothetical protein [Paraburkholderia sp. UYCP14C]
MWIFRVDEPRLGVIRIREWHRRARHTIGLLVVLLACATAGLPILDQSNTSFPNKILTSLWNGLDLIVIANEIIANALVDIISTRVEVGP